MCVTFISEVEVMKEERTVYKVTHFNRTLRRFESVYLPSDRLHQQEERRVGEYLIYEIGKTIKSSFSNSFGLYCFCSKEDAVSYSTDMGCNSIVLELDCSVGTKYRLGLGKNNMKTINVEQAFVKGRG